ncbi:MAG: hypothetical protein PHY14_03240 [Candidatus Gracilibacteria bacterium]|nr:hypothetical protein [Candidatus Gracilibacteria bacterium]
MESVAKTAGLVVGVDVWRDVTRHPASLHFGSTDALRRYQNAYRKLTTEIDMPPKNPKKSA